MKFLTKSLFGLMLLMMSAVLNLNTASITFAQAPDNVSEEFQPLIDAAREKGLSVIVVTPGQNANDEIEVGPDLAERAVKARSELGRIITQFPALPGTIWSRLLNIGGDGGLTWFLTAIVIAVVGIGIGTIPSILINRWLRNQFSDRYNPEPESRAEKISYLMFRAFMMAISVSVMTVIASLTALIADTGHAPTRATVSVIIGGYTIYRVFRHVFFFNLFSPDLPNYRMVNLNSEEAWKIQRQWRSGLLAVVLLCSLFVWIATIGLKPDALKLLVIICLGLSALIVGIILYKSRALLEKVILGAGEPADKPTWRRWLAAQCYALVIGYAAVVWVVSTARITLDKPSSLAIMGAPILTIIGWVVGYCLLLILIDRFYAIQLHRFDEKVKLAHEQNRKRIEAEQQAIAEISDVERPEDDEELIISEIMSAKGMEEMPVFKAVFKSLFEQAAGIFIGIIAIGFLLGTWDVNIGEQGNPVTEFIDTLAIIFVGWFLYRAVIVYVDNQLEEEGVGLEDQGGELGDEGGSGKSASRIATLLPLLRNVLVATIFIMSVMIILSNTGVDIAPLFAGAGVIGLAVGFGAQTLIRDIFSGGFFLFDDAFRKGEYIAMDQIQGTVEKISLRSFQLRHHNGPLHTIPFGEIKQLTNFSRDWVMMKLPLRVTYDTDVERVRKLIKKLGQSLLEHPDVGELFMQPLKSQGVYKMEDSAMILRVKFMTKPGDQFVTRKVVYAAIRDLFEKEGIRFASKEVTVRLADELNEPLTDDQKQAVAAAARRVVDDELQEQAAPKVDDGP